jgi:hypothetical protein
MQWPSNHEKTSPKTLDGNGNCYSCNRNELNLLVKGLHGSICTVMANSKFKTCVRYRQTITYVYMANSICKFPVYRQCQLRSVLVLRSVFTVCFYCVLCIAQETWMSTFIDSVDDKVKYWKLLWFIQNVNVIFLNKGKPNLIRDKDVTISTCQIFQSKFFISTKIRKLILLLCYCHDS